MIAARRLARASCSAAVVLLGLIAVAASARAPDDAATAWTSGPLDVVVALPGPADPAAVAALVGRTIPYYEEGVGTPDAAAEPLGALKVAGARAEDDGRTLILATDPHPRPARYVLPLDGLGRLGKVVYTLDGVEASWSAGAEPGPEPTWKDGLPDLDVRGFGRLATSPRRARRAADLRKPGRLRLDAQVVLDAGKVEGTIGSPAEIVECLFGDGENTIEKTESGGSRVKFTIADASQPVFLSLTVATGPDVPAGPIRIDLDGAAPAGSKPPRFLLPWVSSALATSKPEPLAIPDLAGGDPAKGEEAFFSKEALCSQCHVVRGKGGQVGPDLTTIGRKGVEHLYRSIAVPTESITPDFVTYTVSLKDGRVAAGVVRAEGPDAIRVVDAEAKSATFPRAEIEEFRPGTTSIMPVGLVPVLGEARLRDIVAYLMKTSGK
ncbi:c-type cytochrome [Paludisphaera mucosa]|uniref:C-type cytochrome n=1 Tax=Paludisphaera mucosa TaxID=3030827 RepID=A0ABT6FB29_9BACT|nr:c-type cytochrome [Paludisphaera mucosa]MDG3004794.1 c-type cytochrome [Paludisphaera mucosa]